MHGHDHGHGHSHGHSHGHAHAHICGGPDHHQGDYTPQQRADLDLVLAFNRRMSEAINDRFDVRAVEEVLDPDPLRFMWVDEGQGKVAEMIAGAHAALDAAPRHDGHERAGVDAIAGAQNAARPTVAVGPSGERLVAWTEWIPEQGEYVRASLSGAGEDSLVVSGDVADVYRPTALFTTDGTAWVLFGRRDAGDVAVWATRWTGESWSAPEPVTEARVEGGHPAFNQECVALPGGGLEVVWQARHEDRFAIFARRWTPADGWSETTRVSIGVEANVWDPSVAVFDDGATAYAWSEYAEGSYRVVVRRRSASGELGDPQDLTAGSDYALHPHLAVTRDQQLWCAFDLITVVGHGGSGPTKLRPLAEVGADPSIVEGMRAGGEFVPPELLPEVSASIRVVALTEDGVVDAPGDLAPTLDVVPAGLPKLVPTDDGGLAVAYRIHRRLPLMTYYWEVAAQVLGPDGWLPPTTFSGTDGTLEEVSVAAGPGGEVLIAAQTDERLRVALDWTEGFGGRECPYLHEHHGSVVWHGVHGIGTVVLGQVASAGAAARPSGPASATASLIVQAGDRADARRWAEPAARGGRQERYTVAAGDRNYQVYWGDLHRHSLVSRCTAGDEPSLEDFYRYAWDVCEYDFWAVTDHSENSSDHQWWSIQKIADLFHIDDRFVPLYGFEWTSADTGHQNVIFGDVARGAPIFSAFAEGTQDPAGLWAHMEQHPDFPAITIPHHPGSAMVYNDWDYHHPDYSRLVEIFQACRGNYEALGAFRQYSDATKEGTFVLDGLHRGHRFGFIASSDHGHGASYVGALAESLDRASIFEALHARRTFAATTRDVLIDVRLGDALMGEEVTAAGPVTVSVHAEGYTDLARVDILRDGVVVHATEPGHPVGAGEISVPVRVEWGEADQVATWDGVLEISGGRVVATPYWSPEIVEVGETSVRWACTTASFGEPYGSQRGGVEVTLVGSPDAVVSVRVGARSAEVRLADLRDRDEVEVPGEGPGRLRLQSGIGGLSSLGTTSLDLSWTDPEPVADSKAGPDSESDSESPHGTARFYYARVFQVDGEMAWSSPIWVDPPREGTPTAVIRKSVPPLTLREVRPQGGAILG